MIHPEDVLEWFQNVKSCSAWQDLNNKQRVSARFPYAMGIFKAEYMAIE